MIHPIRKHARFFALAAAVAVASCGVAEQEEPEAQSLNVQDEEGEALDISDEESLTFHDDYEEALAISAEEDKPLIAIFSAEWCPPCQTMKRSVYPSEAVQPFHDQFVWAYLDADVPANRPLMQRFGVSGIPHIAFVKPDGEPLGQFVGGAPPEGFAEILTQVLEDAAEAQGSAEDSEAAGS